jgi:hypothetical protein
VNPRGSARSRTPIRLKSCGSCKSRVQTLCWSAGKSISPVTNFIRDHGIKNVRACRYFQRKVASTIYVEDDRIPKTFLTALPSSQNVPEKPRNFESVVLDQGKDPQRFPPRPNDPMYEIAIESNFCIIGAP